MDVETKAKANQFSQDGQTEQRPAAPAKKLKGTAAMDPERRREIARKGGLAVAKNRQHMAEIGRKGGVSIAKDRDHMAAIGRAGGKMPKKPRDL